MPTFIRVGMIRSGFSAAIGLGVGWLMSGGLGLGGRPKYACAFLKCLGIRRSSLHTKESSKFRMKRKPGVGSPYKACHFDSQASSIGYSYLSDEAAYCRLLAA